MTTELKTEKKDVIDLAIWVGLFIIKLFCFQYIIAEIFEKTISVWNLGITSILLGIITPKRYRGLQTALGIVGTIYIYCSK